MSSWLHQTLKWKRNVPLAYDRLRGDEFSKKSTVRSVDVPFLEADSMPFSTMQTLPKKPVVTIIGILSALVVILTSLLVFQIPRTKRWPVPDFPLSTKVFQSEQEWEFSSKADQLWNSLLPNSGLILVESWQDYGLNPGLKTTVESALVYGVSVAHQYHCLKMIRENFYGLATQNQTYIDELTTSTDFSKRPAFKVKHIFHCIDYLRQVILCKSDTTLEWRSDVDPVHIDGYGPPHQCRNWDDFQSWMRSKLPPDPMYHERQ